MDLKKIKLQTLYFEEAKNINGGGDKIVDFKKLFEPTPAFPIIPLPF